MTTALVLSGGGARAAYQVGVLRALADILPPERYNPFPIICGTSAGAINTLAMAGRRGHFNERSASLETMWRELSAERIYRTDIRGVLSNTLKLAMSMLYGGSRHLPPVALLNNAPLRELLEGYIHFRHIDEAVASGELQAVAITAMSYATGKSLTFFQGDHDNWHRARRLGIRTGLTMDHLMASAAIPTIFPPVKIGDSYYGDGALRQLKPLSPALHLGADRVFVVGVSDNPLHHINRETAHYSPTVSQMVGHLLNSAFIDTLESDLETLKTINRLACALGREELEKTGIQDLKPIDYLVITPSQPINEMAQQHLGELPRSVRAFLRLTGTSSHGGGASAASYLLFEPGFCGHLIDLGYRDTMDQKSTVSDFFSGGRAVC